VERDKNFKFRYNLISMKNKFPFGVRLIAWATGIRWIGWGLVEPIIPIFLFTFGHSYVNAGLLKSSFDIAYLIFLPIAGALIDRKYAKIIIIAGLVAYPFIGLSYFLAGFLGVAAFIVLARILNGFAYAFDSIGRATYYMRSVENKHISSAFGHFDTVSGFIYSSALLLGLLIIPRFEFEWLALAIIPFSIIGLLIIWFWLPKKQPANSIQKYHHSFSKSFFKNIGKEIKNWNFELKLVGLFVFFLGFIKSTAGFILPIFAFTQGSSILQIVFMAVLLNIPALFGNILGRVADKNRLASVIFGLCVAAFFFFVLAINQNYIFILATILGIGLAGEIVSLSGNGITARLTRPSHYGKTNSAMDSLRQVGALSSPLLLGFLLDSFNSTLTFAAIGIASTVIALMIFIFQKKFQTVSVHAYHQKRHIG